MFMFDIFHQIKGLVFSYELKCSPNKTKNFNQWGKNTYYINKQIKKNYIFVLIIYIYIIK